MTAWTEGPDPVASPGLRAPLPAGPGGSLTAGGALAAPGAVDFDVQLGSLRRFAEQLRAEADVLDARTRELGALDAVAGDRALFGDFAEAHTLAQLHAQAVQRLHNLYRQVAAMVRFADGVATDVADHYEHHDGRADESFRRLAVDDSSAVGRLVKDL